MAAIYLPPRRNQQAGIPRACKQVVRRSQIQFVRVSRICLEGIERQKIEVIGRSLGKIVRKRDYWRLPDPGSHRVGELVSAQVSLALRRRGRHRFIPMEQYPDL